MGEFDIPSNEEFEVNLYIQNKFFIERNQEY